MSDAIPTTLYPALAGSFALATTHFIDKLWFFRIYPDSEYNRSFLKAIPYMYFSSWGFSSAIQYYKGAAVLKDASKKVDEGEFAASFLGQILGYSTIASSVLFKGSVDDQLTNPFRGGYSILIGVATASSELYIKPQTPQNKLGLGTVVPLGVTVVYAVIMGGLNVFRMRNRIGLSSVVIHLLTSLIVARGQM